MSVPTATASLAATAGPAFSLRSQCGLRSSFLLRRLRGIHLGEPCLRGRLADRRVAILDRGKAALDLQAGGAQRGLGIDVEMARDVAAAHVDPLRHFQTTGWKEERNPNAFFDTKGYLST